MDNKEEIIEYIVFAAMKQENTDKEIKVENHNFRVGFNHGDIISANMFNHIKVETSNPDSYGFITSTGRFVNRREAVEIARKNNQLRKGYEDSVSLNSYEIDLYSASQRLKEENSALYYKLICIDNEYGK